MERWGGVRRLALDWLVPLVILGIGAVDVGTQPHSTAYPGSPVAHVAFLGLGTGLLGVRRKAPLLAPLLAIVAVTWWTAQLWSSDQQGPFEGFLVLVGAAYSLGAANAGRRLVVAGAALVIFFVIGQLVVLGGGASDGDLVPLVLWSVVGFGIGVLIRSRTHEARAAREEVVRTTAEQESRTAHAVEEERARIARELHDVVAHALSVIVVQAGVERRSLGGGVVDAEALDDTLGSIETAGREALVDLRRLLGLLRRTDEPVALAPQPGLAQLDDLLDAVRDTGVVVDLVITGERADLPAGLDLTAYRIVQEALTNVLKHAEAQHVRVGLAFGRGQLQIEVVDDGHGAAHALSHVGGGHGLIGMRERASVFGGEVSAGPTTDRGWRVCTRLPLSPVAAG